MDFSYIFELDKFFHSHRYPVPLQDILHHFGYSRNTFHRIRTEMCDYLGAPIKNKRGQGYYYDLKSGEIFELPGLWFSSKEIVSLALLQQISEALQPDTVKQLLQPVSERLNQLLAKQQVQPNDWQDRIKIASQWQRSCEPEFFTDVAYALLHRKQLEIDYWQWQTDIIETRMISPQRLIYYRDNWYLDAWCHKRNALRTFSIDAIYQTHKTQTNAKNIPAEQLDRHVTAGYGIFSGQVKAIALLKFTKRIAKRVSRESWHPNQKSSWTKQDEYLLSVPYSDDRELLRDIMHHGSDVEVLSPKSLQSTLKNELSTMLEKYF